MNTYSKFVPNVFLAKCEEKHEKGEVIEVTTKQYSRKGEATIITPNTGNNSISLRAWKSIFDEHKNKKERR